MRYPGAVRDPDTGAWMCDAEVSYTAFAPTNDRVTTRLVVRRVKDARYPDALFPVWRYHLFCINTDLPTAQADIVACRHAIIETVVADLIDGPLAHLPSGRFGASSCGCSAPCLRTTCSTPPTPSPINPTPQEPMPATRGATLRRQLITVPARLARLARTPILHLPSRRPWAPAWQRLWDRTIGTAHPSPPDHLPRRHRPEHLAGGRAGQTSNSHAPPHRRTTISETEITTAAGAADRG